MRSDAVKTKDQGPKDRFRQLAGEVISEISALDSSHSRELLGAFVSELFLTVVEQERSAERRQRQIECIAAAKERGVRFGPAPQAAAG